MPERIRPVFPHRAMAGTVSAESSSLGAALYRFFFQPVDLNARFIAIELKHMYEMPACEQKAQHESKQQKDQKNHVKKIHGCCPLLCGKS